jgi:hypothetical protein
MARQPSTKYHLRRRIFLNDDVTMPAVAIGMVEDTREIPNDDRELWRWSYTELTFSDCNRRISFDLPLGTRADRTQTLKKLNRMAEIIIAVRDAIELEVASQNARPRIPRDFEKEKQIKHWARMISSGIEENWPKPKVKLKPPPGPTPTAPKKKVKAKAATAR